MRPNTHLGIDPALCGAPSDLGEGRASVRLLTLPTMAADDRGLVHGGFVFGAADYAAMLAVNDPYVVLGAADTRFLAPVRVGDEVVATAARTAHEGKKHVIEVVCAVGDKVVMKGTFTTFALPGHVLDR